MTHQLDPFAGEHPQQQHHLGLVYLLRRQLPAEAALIEEGHEGEISHQRWRRQCGQVDGVETPQLSPIERPR